MSENIDFLEIVERIFKIDPTNPELLITGETTEVEFKANFHSQTNKWDEYGRTIAGFANNLGGCLVFGIDPAMPHRLTGMQNNHFEILDCDHLASYLNSRFSPEILFRKYIHRIDQKKFGLIYVKKNYFRPVIATKTGDDGKTIRESDIFYRYEARSERIKYSELIQILDERRQREQEMWMQHLRKIVSIGVENAAIFNPDDGTVSGDKGTFIIDSELLSKISFIREGAFQEVTGKPGIPTLKIVGDVEILAAGEIKRNSLTEKERITRRDIFEDFLLQNKPNQPRLYLEQACYEATWYLPIYYYAILAEFDVEMLKEVIESQESTGNTKKAILKRINTGDKSLFKDISGSSKSESKHTKMEYRQSFISQSFSSVSLDEISNDEQKIQYALSSLQSLKREEIDVDYIFPILHQWLDKWYFNENSESIIRTNFNKVICHLDKEMFFQKLTIIE